MTRGRHGPWRRLRAGLAGLAGLLLTLPSGAGWAGLSPDQLDRIGVEERVGNPLPRDLRLTEESGQMARLGDLLAGEPAALLFADYECRMVCTPALRVLGGALAELPAEAATRFRVLVVGLRGSDGPAEATAARKAYFPQDGAGAVDRARFLTATDAVVAELAATTGYGFAYDEERGEFAHPVALTMVNGAGEITRYLTPLGMTGKDLATAIGEADAVPQDLGAAIRAVCYRFGAAVGRYTPLINDIMPLLGLATMLAIGAGLFRMSRRRRRERREAEHG